MNKKMEQLKNAARYEFCKLTFIAFDKVLDAMQDLCDFVNKNKDKNMKDLFDKFKQVYDALVELINTSRGSAKTIDYKAKEAVEVKIKVMDSKIIEKPLKSCEYILISMTDNKELDKELFSVEMDTFLNSMEYLSDYGKNIMKKTIEEMTEECLKDEKSNEFLN